MVMDNPVKRFREFILAPSHSRTISAVVILIIAAAIPLTVLVAQQQQEIRQRAATAVCQNTARQCTGYNTYQTCNSGTWSSTQYCASGTYCQSLSSFNGISPYASCKTITDAPTAVCTTNQDCLYGGTNADCQTGSCMERRDACQSGKCIDISANSSRCSNTGCAGKTVCSNGQLCSNLTCNSSGACSATAGTGASCVPSSSCGTTTTKYACGSSGCAVSSTGTFTESTCGGTCGTTTLPTPIGTPSTAKATGLNVKTYCGVGPYPGTISNSGQSYVSSTTFYWTNPSGAYGGAYVYYKDLTSGIIKGPYMNGPTGTGNSFYSPRQAGDVSVYNPLNGANYNFTQGLGNPNEAGSGWSGGFFPYGHTIEWWVTTTTGNVVSDRSTYVTASCGTAACTPKTCSLLGFECGTASDGCGGTLQCGVDSAGNAPGTLCNPGTGLVCTSNNKCVQQTAPNCGALSANPPNVSINGNSNLSISCTNTTASTTYTWTSNTCGNVVNVNSSSTSWTGPATGPATCPVSVNVCNGTSCSTGNVTIPVTIPDCNAGLQPTSACVATISNTCQANNGTQTAQYRTYNGSTVCNPVNTTQTCTISSCNVGNICTNGTCSTPTPTATATPNPSGSPTPTPTPVPGNTYIAFTIGMDAVGSAGDNVNPNPSSSNQNPANTTRNLAVQILNSNNNQVFAQVGSISYNSGPGVFKDTVDLGANFASGNYLVLVKSDGHLRRRIPGIQNLTSALPQPIQLQRVNLVTGDVDNNNVLNINDYNILLSCVTDPDVANIDNHALCNSNANYVKLSDLEDNNVVNKFDYNLFLREYAVQSGD